MENFIINLYIKYLYGDITRDEFLEMRHALNKADNDQLSELLKEEWDEDILMERMDARSKEHIRSELNFYIENNKGKSINKKRILFMAAAVVSLIIVFSSFLVLLRFSTQEPDHFMVSVERGNKSLVTLPDQSKVWINSNSTIEYARERNNTRHVKLNGEAFFKVAQDKDHPFIVSMNNLHVEVLGTSFNAKSRIGSDIIETSLVEGKIKLLSSDLSQDYYLNPNEKAIYNQSTKRIQIMHTDNELETAWKDNKLKFSSERFIDVLAMLEDWYGVRIINKYTEIENDLISGSFKDEKIEAALNVLKIQYDVDFVRNGDTIEIVKSIKKTGH